MVFGFRGFSKQTKVPALGLPGDLPKAAMFWVSGRLDLALPTMNYFG